MEIGQGEVDKAIDKKRLFVGKKIVADGIKLATDNNHPGTVNQWKKTYSATEWKETIEKVIQEKINKVTKEHNSNKNKSWHSPNLRFLAFLAPIYIAEEYWDRLLLLVQQDNQLETVLRYHQHLAKKHPTDLLEIYLTAFEREGDKVGKRRDYADLASKMEKVINDIPEGKEKIRAIAVKLKSKYPRRPAMIDELNRILY